MMKDWPIGITTISIQECMSLNINWLMENYLIDHKAIKYLPAGLMSEFSFAFVDFISFMISPQDNKANC